MTLLTFTFCTIQMCLRHALKLSLLQILHCQGKSAWNESGGFKAYILLQVRHFLEMQIQWLQTISRSAGNALTTGATAKLTVAIFLSRSYADIHYYSAMLQATDFFFSRWSKICAWHTYSCADVSGADVDDRCPKTCFCQMTAGN